MLALLVAPAWAQEAPPVVVVASDGAPLAQMGPTTEATPRTVPLRISIVPGIGLAAAPDVAVDGLSVGFFSKAAALDGIDAEVGVSWVDGPVHGVQAAVGLNVADDLDGVQAAVGINVADHVRGAQLSSGVNWARGDVDMAQLSAGLNVAEGTVRGVQAAAGLNVAGAAAGLQAAPLNIAGDLDGLQLGLLNVGGDVRGVQVGLVNVAKRSVVSIGLLNFVGNGLHKVDVWTSESSIGTAAVKFGSRHVYTLLGAGWVNPTQPYWTFGGGFGVHLPARPVWFEIDATGWSIADGRQLLPGVHGKLRAQVGLDIAPHFAPFVGVSVNSWTGSGTVLPRAVGIPSGGEGRFVTWPGFHAGLSF